MSNIIQLPNGLKPGREPNQNGNSKSIRYRRRASRLGDLANAKSDETEVFPLVQQALSWIMLAENEELLARFDHRPIVLIVEDEPLLRADVAAAVVAAGFEICKADNAEAAISVLESDLEVNVVLTGMKTPGSMDGLSLVAAIKDRWPSVKIITTRGILESSDLKIPDGSIFLPEPYSAEQVVGTLHHLLRTEVQGSP